MKTLIKLDKKSFLKLKKMIHVNFIFTDLELRNKGINNFYINPHADAIFVYETPKGFVMPSVIDQYSSKCYEGIPGAYSEIDYALCNMECSTVIDSNRREKIIQILKRAKRILREVLMEELKCEK